MDRDRKSKRESNNTIEKTPEVTAANQEQQSKEDQKRSRKELLFQAASERWKSLDHETEKAFFTVKIKELRQYYSTHRTASTVLKLSLPAAVQEGVFGLHAICFKCCLTFQSENQFQLHLDTHFGSYFMAAHMHIHRIDPKSIQAIEISTWNPFDVEKMERMIMEAKTPPTEFPLSTDSERVRLVKEINVTLRSLHKGNCLTESVIQFIKRAAQIEFGGTFMAPALEHISIVLIICFLRAPFLRRILKVLQAIVSVSAIDDSICFDPENRNSGPHDGDPRVSISTDRTNLLLDTNVFGEKERCDDEIGADSVNSTKLVSWIFSDQSFEERLETWSAHRDQGEMFVLKIFEEIGRHIDISRECWRSKPQLTAHAAAYESLNKLLKYEFTRGVKSSFLDILITRKKEHDKAECRSKSIQIKYESSAIERVISKATDMAKASSTPSTGQISNRSLQMAIDKLNKEISLEIMKTDTRLKRACYKVQCLKSSIRQHSLFSYTPIILPLIHTFLRPRFEGLLDGSEAALIEKVAELEGSEAGVAGQGAKQEGSAIGIEASLALLQIRTGEGSESSELSNEKKMEDKNGKGRRKRRK